jgi:hypothetical protein
LLPPSPSTNSACFILIPFLFISRFCIQERAYSVWLILLNMVIASSIHFLAYDIISFFMAHIPLGAPTTFFFSIHLFDGHLGCCHRLAVVSSAGVSVVCWLTSLQIHGQEWHSRITW